MPEEEIKQTTAPTGNETQFEANQRVADLEVPTVDNSTKAAEAPVLTDDYKQSVAKLTVQPEIKPEPTTPQEASEFREDTVVTNANKAPTKSDKVIKKDIGGYDFSESLQEVFKRGQETGKTKEQLVNAFKSRLEGAGFDTTKFDQTYSKTIEDFESLNQSSDDFFKGLQDGETYGKFYEKNSADYKVAKIRFNNFNSVIKTPEGLTLAVNDGTLASNNTLFKDLMAVPEYAAIIKQAQQDKLDNKIKDTKNLGNKTLGELEEITNFYGDKYTFDASTVEDELANNKILASNKAGYLSATSGASATYAKMKGVRSSLKAKYPNASPAFIQAQYDKQSAALEEEYNEQVSAASTYENAYKFELGEKEMVWDAQESEIADRKAIFTDLFNKKWGADREATQEQWRVDREKLSNKNVVTWKTSDAGKLTGINKQGEVIVSLDGYKPLEGSKAKATTYKQEWADGKGYDIVVIGDDNIPKTTKHRYDGEALVKSNYVKGLGTITNLGNRVTGDNGLDISSPLGTDVPAKSNVEVKDFDYSSTFGNYVTVVDEQGNQIRYSHLQNKYTGKIGDLIGVGDTIGQVGNTGYTLTADGNGGWREPTEEELLAGKGAHIDIGSWDANGVMRSGLETKNFLEGKTDSKGDNVLSDNNYTFVLSQLDTKMKDSNEDKAEIRAFVERQTALGMDKYDIADLFQGFEVEEGDDFGKRIRDLIYITGSKPSMGELGRKIARGDKEGALKLVYNNAEGEAKDLYGDDYISSSFARTSTNQVNNVLSEMESNGLKDGVGVIEGTFENFIGGKFRDEEAQEILTKVKNLTAAMRNKLAGTAVTDAEVKFISDLMPDIGDTPDVFFAKLNNLKENPLQKYNDQMEGYDLPRLSEGQLINFKERVGLYTGAAKPTAKGRRGATTQGRRNKK